METDKNIRLKLARERLGMTRTEFAKLLGFNFTSYCSIERGERTLVPKLMLLIDEKTDINRDWLETGEGEMMKADRYKTLYDLIMKLNPDDRDMVIGMVKRLSRENDQSQE